MLVAAQIYMTVLLDGDVRIAFHKIWCLRQISKRHSLDRMEVLFASICPLLHTSLVMSDKQLIHRHIQLFQGEELPMLKSCIYPMVYHLHLIFYKRLLSWFGRLARYDDEAVMIAHVLHRLVYRGFILVSSRHGSLKVIGNNYFRNAAIELQCTSQGIQEVLSLLRWNT